MTSRELSADEMKQYDRQLRLWGLTSQTRMLKSKVLVVGLGGMGVEICKNLILAGVGSLTVMDHKDVQMRDLGSQFFLSEDDVGKNRAESSLESLSALNPNVTITIDQSDISKKDANFFEQFTAVCLTDTDARTQVKVNTLCRSSSKNIYFFSVECFGWYGYFHQDLRSHQYTIKKQSENEEETKSEEVAVSYDPLTTIYGATWPSVTKIFGKRLLSTAKLYCAFQVIHAFRDQTNRLPSLEDLPQCYEVRDRLSAANNTAAGWLTDDIVRGVVSVCDCILNPVCTIFGGLISSEVLKVISGQDKPWDNTVVFDAQASQAVPKNIK